MTLDEIKSCVAKIADMRSDPEMAHAEEDNLYLLFIEHVAETADIAIAEMASEVLKAREIRFPRWFA